MHGPWVRRRLPSPVWRYAVLGLGLCGLVAAGLVWAKSYPSTADPIQAMQMVMGSTMQGYVLSGCLPAPSATTTVSLPPCRAHGLVGPPPARLVGFEEPTARSLTLPATNGAYWLAGRPDVASTPAGWTCLAGQHYCWLASATIPAIPAGLLRLAKLTVVGGAVTLVGDLRKSNGSPDGLLVATDALWGAKGDWNGTTGTDDTAALQALLTAACDQNAEAVIPPSVAGVGYRITSTLQLTTSCPGNKGFQLRMPGQARLYGDNLGAGTYALLLQGMQRAKVHVQIELIGEGNGVHIEEAGAASLWNEVSGELIAAGRAPTKPAVGSGSMGLRFTQTGGGVANWWNVVEKIRIRRFDTAIYLTWGANAQRFIQPALEDYWYGLAILGGESSLVGLWCLNAGGQVGSETECLHLGSVALGKNATFNNLVGIASEAGANSRVLVVEAGSIGNIIEMADNSNLGMVLDEPLNTVISRGITHLGRRTILGDGTWDGSRVSLGQQTFLWRSDDPLDNNSLRFTTNGEPQAENSGWLVPKLFVGSGSLDFGAVAPNSCESLTITVNGANLGDGVLLGLPPALGNTPNAIFSGFVSAVDTVSVRRCNVSVVTLADPAAETVLAMVMRY